MLEKLQLPRFGLPFLSGGAGGRGRSAGASAAARLQSRLPTLQRPPQRWRELLVHAVDLQQEIDALQPPPGLTGRWRKCKARGAAGWSHLPACGCPLFFLGGCHHGNGCCHSTAGKSSLTLLPALPPHALQDSSDSMADAFEMVELPWLFRKAVAVLNVLEVGGGSP